MQKRAHQKITTLIEQTKIENFTSSEIQLKQYNYETTLVKNNQKIKLLVYFGKKGVKTVLQGNSDSKEYLELNSIITGNYSLEFDTEKEINLEDYIGTDETGKGDYFGPLIVAGFYTNSEINNYLVSIGVKDSKELTDFQIDNIAQQIKTKYPNNYSIISIHPDKYNQLYENFKNLNKLLNWAHSKAIETLLNIIKTKNVIIDKFSKEPLSISTKSEFENINFVQITKAEKYLGVAAASILARNEMNNWFRKKQSEGFDVLKGASFEVETSAKKIHSIHGNETLRNLVKLHFKTTKKIFKD